MEGFREQYVCRVTRCSHYGLSVILERSSTHRKWSSWPQGRPEDPCQTQRRRGTRRRVRSLDWSRVRNRVGNDPNDVLVSHMSSTTLGLFGTRAGRDFCDRPVTSHRRLGHPLATLPPPVVDIVRPTAGSTSCSAQSKVVSTIQPFQSGPTICLGLRGSTEEYRTSLRDQTSVLVDCEKDWNHRPDLK